MIAWTYTYARAHSILMEQNLIHELKKENAWHAVFVSMHSFMQFCASLNMSKSKQNVIHFTCLNRIIDNGGSVIHFLRNSLETKQIILIYIMQSLTLIYGENLGKRIGQKIHLPIRSVLLKCLTSLLRRLHNTGAEFVDRTNKAFICDLKHGTVTIFAWCC